MGQFEPAAAGTPTSTSRTARGSLLGALFSASLAVAAVSSAGVADATCTSVSGTGAGARCSNTPTSSAARLDKNSSASAQGLFNGAVPSGNRSNATAGALPSPDPATSTPLARSVIP